MKSLIQTSEQLAAAAPLLFSPEEMAAEYIGDPAAQGHYSAERLFSQRPEIYREIVDQLAQGCSRRSIKSRCKVHHKTIDAVESREAGTIDTLRKGYARKFYATGNLIGESLYEDVIEGRLKPEAKAFAAKTMIDISQLLSGGATTRVERVEPVNVAAALDDFIDGLPLADAEEVPAICLSDGNILPLSAPVPAADPAAVEDPAAELALTDIEAALVISTTDEQSAVSTPSNSLEDETATPNATEGGSPSSIKRPKKIKAGPGSAAGSDSSKRGGRGSRRKGGPVSID